MWGHALRCTMISFPLLASSCLSQIIKQIFCSSQEVFGFAWPREAPAVCMRMCHQPLTTYKEGLATFKMLLVSLPHWYLHVPNGAREAADYQWPFDSPSHYLASAVTNTWTFLNNVAIATVVTFRDVWWNCLTQWIVSKYSKHSLYRPYLSAWFFLNVFLTFVN